MYEYRRIKIGKKKLVMIKNGKSIGTREGGNRKSVGVHEEGNKRSAHFLRGIGSLTFLL